MAQITVASENTLQDVKRAITNSSTDVLDISSLMYINDLVTNGENSYVYNDDVLKSQLFTSRMALRSSTIGQTIFDFGIEHNLNIGQCFKNLLRSNAEYWDDLKTMSDVANTSEALTEVMNDSVASSLIFGNKTENCIIPIISKSYGRNIIRTNSSLSSKFNNISNDIKISYIKNITGITNLTSETNSGYSTSIYYKDNLKSILSNLTSRFIYLRSSDMSNVNFKKCSYKNYGYENYTIQVNNSFSSMTPNKSFCMISNITTNSSNSVWSCGYASISNIIDSSTDDIIANKRYYAITGTPLSNVIYAINPSVISVEEGHYQGSNIYNLAGMNMSTYYL